MSICAPKPFGSKFLKGGYGYWPLWWYGQKNKLHDMSGHGLDVFPTDGAYFDGQGYYFDGVDDTLRDAGNRRILTLQTVGTWQSLYLTDDEVPPEGTAIGTGTSLGINIHGDSPKLTGKIALYPEYCPNIIYFNCRYNRFSVLDVSRVTTLEILGCLDNNISTLNVSASTGLTGIWCFDNNIPTLDVSALTKLSTLSCYNNSMDESAVDAVLCALASHSVEDGTLQIQGNAPPSLDGEDCKYILVHDLGWSVTTD
ncbi:hypothetical protein DRN85_10115 [Methanosarcinales archaeon]|nr:MAG: hypothetical protein DRN85_10115 [Methanosarcinales archaeon]